jgi:hypothetical protein
VIIEPICDPATVFHEGQQLAYPPADPLARKSERRPQTTCPCACIAGDSPQSHHGPQRVLPVRLPLARSIALLPTLNPASLPPPPSSPLIRVGIPPVPPALPPHSLFTHAMLSFTFKPFLTPCGSTLASFSFPSPSALRPSRLSRLVSSPPPCPSGCIPSPRQARVWRGRPRTSSTLPPSSAPAGSPLARRNPSHHPSHNFEQSSRYSYESSSESVPESFSEYLSESFFES